MLDIKFIRENLDLIKMGAQKKHIKVDLDALIALDDRRRAALASIEAKRQNRMLHQRKSQQRVMQLIVHNLSLK